ncbi:hypothetical protein M407DRAFT_32362 [Tulasnella calospora MUT 4182]|uniref:Clp R domain-containing protein n=1 Tax=Tulasnella calospora MUT 4182 TaxID=1051891 RepID=A0A0C3Q4W0_9AGAM|nr:hypothetical protein M407DRAFT_32362 [Tulasnella calospora MUT 4182]
METQYCPRPPLSPPPTPPPDPSRADPSDLLLNEESDELWISALDIARSLEDPGIQIDPHHLILALLYKGINNIDDVIVRFREPPILDIPLLWKVVQEAGGNPQALAIDIRQRWLSELQIRPIDEQTPQDLQPTPDQHVLLRNCSEETKEVLLAAKDSLAKTDDSFVAPHHIILALMENYRVASLLISQNLNPARLASLTRQYRPHRVVTRKNKPRFLVLKQLSGPQFASDLTEEAKQDRIGPVIGRDEEIRRLTVILSRRYKCNAILLGESGVGKTAVAEGLALRICSRDVPEELNCRIFSLDMGSLLASTTCHGKLELRVKAILEEIQENEAEGVKIILYIDSFHLITMGRKTGGAGGMDVANLMKPLLARGKLRCFGSATYHDYKNSVETDGSLVRRFAPIVICEPTAPQTVTILRGLKSRMEKHHTLSITDAALEEAAYLSARYVAYKRLPDSAIELVDEACSMLRVNQVLRPESLDKLLNKKRTLEQEIRCLSLEWERNSVDSQIQRMRAQESLQSVIHDIEAAEKDLSLEQNLKNKIMKLEAEIAIGEVELKRIAKQKKSQRMRSAEVLRGKLRKNKEDLKRAKKEYFDDSLCSSRVTPAVIAQVISEQTEIPIQSVMAHERPYYISLEKDLNNAVAGQPEATRAISQAIHFSRSGFSNPGRPVASMLLVGGPGTGKTFIAKELARLLFDSEEKLLVINGAEYTSTLNLIRLAR